MLKRSFDILIAAILLIVTFPIWVIVAILIRSHDGGPVFYRQKRIGLGGEPFDILKFRSMVRNADKTGSYSTADNDVRITPIGRLLRRYSLDELPQMLNVLSGKMSLVGPRPDVPAQRVLYSDVDFARRNSVRPGITGLAQATLRSSATQEERLQHDLEYIDRMCFLFDIRVIVLTIRQIITRGGN